MKIWIISDTHFNHLKLLRLEERPENFNELIVRNWNKQVKPEDLVIHLGDVILGRDSELPDFLKRLNGTKILTRGNHDKKTQLWYMQRGFSFVCDYFIYRNVAFAHTPLTPIPHRALKHQSEEVDLCIHGHFHKSVHRGHPDMQDDYYDVDYYHVHKEKYHLIQIEDTFRPILLDHVLKEHNL